MFDLRSRAVALSMYALPLGMAFTLGTTRARTERLGTLLLTCLTFCLALSLTIDLTGVIFGAIIIVNVLFAVLLGALAVPLFAAGRTTYE